MPLRRKPRKRTKTPGDGGVRLVVGLRNPGAEYEGTRHNVGYEVVAAVAANAGAKFGRGPRRTRCQTAEVTVAGRRLVLAVPMAFMNQSGGPVRALVDYFSVPVSDMLVVHDDIDLPFGRLRLQRGGGTGGHNGLRSLESALQARDFHRLKVGVGRPPGDQDPAAYVLNRFGRGEREEVDSLVADAAGVVEDWASDLETAVRRAGERRP